MVQSDAAARWAELVAHVRQLRRPRAAATTADRPSLIEAARVSLGDVRQQRAALEVLALLDPAVTLALLEDVVRIAAHTQGDALLVRQVLGRLPRAAIAPPLHQAVLRRLDAADDDEYRRLAETARHLGLDATLRAIVDRALASPDPLTREVGEDFGS
jgi:hypothetical protein